MGTIYSKRYPDPFENRRPLRRRKMVGDRDHFVFEIAVAMGVADTVGVGDGDP
jgi:hypothetical protein